MYLILCRLYIVINCIKKTNKMHFFICVYSKTLLYMFRTDTLFIIRSLRITAYAADCTYRANSD